MINYTIVESNSLKFDEEDNDFNKFIRYNHACKLHEVAENLPIWDNISGDILRLHSTEMSAGSVVGVVHADGCMLEILPKIDVNDVGGLKDRNLKIRKRLIQMLSVAYKIQIDVGELTALASQNATLLEILIGIFATKLTEAVKKGLPQTYIEFNEDLSTLQGTLDITRQFTIHAANPAILACRFDNFSQDIALNQVMKSAVSFLGKISKNIFNQKLLHELELIYADVSLIPAKNLRWDLIIKNRTNDSWEELCSLAKLLLNQKYQTTTSGEIKGYSLLFEMNKLFEEYIGQLVKRAAVRLREKYENYSQLSVQLQSRNNYCLLDETTNNRVFWIKPDIVVDYGNNEMRIIDTKWKNIYSKDFKIWKSVKQSDVYQLMAYGHLYNSNRITLLYPHNNSLNETEGIQRIGYIHSEKPEPKRILEIVSFDVSNKLNEIERIEGILKLAHDSYPSPMD